MNHNNDPSYNQLNDYSSYLQAQVDKFSAFMISQKKLNQKHLEIQQSLNYCIKKMQKLQQKIHLVQITEKDNLFQIKKLKTGNDNVHTLQMRIQNIENQLLQIQKDQQQSQSINQSQHNFHNNYNSKRQAVKSVAKKSQICLDQIQQIKQRLANYLIRDQVDELINNLRNDVQIKIKKIQIEIQKTKESFIKLTSNMNNLANFNQPFPFKRQSKNQIKTSQSARQIANTTQNITSATKKQLKKMERKLQNFFTQKLEQIANKNHQQDFSKGMRFKKIQQKYEKQMAQSQNKISIKSQKKSENKSYGSLKKIPLFENQVLKQKQLSERRFFQNEYNKKKRKQNKSKDKKQSPIAYLQSPKYTGGREVNRDLNMKKISKHSKEKLRKVNSDYMIK